MTKLFYINQIIYLFKATYAMQTTFVCKLWKLQSGPSDQHPRGGAQGRGRGDLQKCDYPIEGRIQIVKLSHPHAPWMLIRWPRLEFS